MMKHLQTFFGYPDVGVMSLLTLLMAAVALLLAPRPGLWLAFLLGVALFFLSEYLTHRFLFHMEPPQHPGLRRLLSRLHYHHHEKPNDLDLLFLPLWYSLPLLVVFGLVSRWVTGNWGLAAAFLTGAMSLLLYYEWSHYVAHRPINPITPWGRWMKKYHLWHHFKNEHYWYGVTNPSLDLLFGTYREVDSVAKSPTARKLDGPQTEVAATREPDA